MDGWQGLDYIKREGAFVNDYIQNNTPVANKVDGGFYPKQGLPGPCSRARKEGGPMVLCQSDWFLFDNNGGVAIGLFHSVGRVGERRLKKQGATFL